MSLHKEYHKLPSGHDIETSIQFNKNNNSVPKGYRVSVFPVKITDHEGFQMVEFGAYTGFNDTLLPADRQSAKRLEQAKKILTERLPDYLKYPFTLK